MADKIILRGLREHNLKGVDVAIRLYGAHAVIGPSGAGKSTLVFDTIHSEAERRFIETFSPYVRQFLERRPRPKADFITGLPASIAVTASNPVRNARSVVATLAEITYPVRHLYFRLARLYCPDCGVQIKQHTIGDALGLISQLRAQHRGGIFVIGAPVAPCYHRLKDLESRGYTRCLVNGAIRRLDEVSDTPIEDTFFVVIDRIRLDVPLDEAHIRERLTEAMELGYLEGNGKVSCFLVPKEKGMPAAGPFNFVRDRSCPTCGKRFRAPTLALFSFNSPMGACPVCQGFGRVTGIDWDLVVPDRRKSIQEGAVKPLESWEYEKGLLIEVLEEAGIDTTQPWAELPARAKEIVFHGYSHWPGLEEIFKELESYRYKAHVRILLARYRAYNTCEACKGRRFSQEALSYRLIDKDIGEFYAQSISGALEWLRSNEAHFTQDKANENLFFELVQRLETLELAGIGYLTLDRQSRTLSGGEMLRVALSRSLGSALKDTLYCLDEPTRGLHPHDVQGVLKVIERLLDRGNTIISVTHDPAIIEHSTNVLSLGPGAGKDGGRVVYSGPPRDSVLREYQYHSVRSLISTRHVPQSHEANREKAIVLNRVTCNNLKGITVKFPLGAITVVTGVSGSGKSSLVHDVLYRAVKRHLGEPVEPSGSLESILGMDVIDHVVLVDQSQLSRTPRATVATFTGVLEPIRNAYAATPQAKAMGLRPGSFSFNSPIGRCQLCKGLGVEVLEMQFLPDIELQCPQCKGTRFRPEVREVELRGLRFDKCLSMTVDEAADFFKGEENVLRPLNSLKRVGLGHLKLDQRLSALAGGEAQRLRLSKAFIERQDGHTLYCLDEPTRGLHPKETIFIIKACLDLVRGGRATCVVVEHNPQFIENAHWLIELGPGGGDHGGRLIFQGRPDGIHSCDKSKTAPYLQPEARAVGDRVLDVSCAKRPSDENIVVKGARHHNLKAIDVKIPRKKFVVITGPSGSGKSTLAFDILHTEGERRYIECLPTYMRQFIRLYERPDVDEVLGLSPSVAIKQRKAKSGPMSTVATLTEVAHYLRLLYSKVAHARCPECGRILREFLKEDILQAIKEHYGGKEIYLIAPRISKRKGFFKNILEQAKPSGASLVIVDGKYYPVTDLPELERYSTHSISWVYGPYVPDESTFPESFSRIIYLGGGVVGVRPLDRGPIEYFSVKRSCAECGIGVPDPDPLLFSFNTETGRCPNCKGLGKDPVKASAKCSVCQGTRLSKEALSWIIDEKNLADVMGLEVTQARELLCFWRQKRPWPDRLDPVAQPLVKEVETRLGFLEDVGLGYLQLSRAGNTLSGGEEQRIRLAAQIGAGLTGLTIVLDEPTIGLHPVDNRRLLKVLRRLKEIGNSVIVVEHDEETIRSADWVIDLGPGGGKDGGRVVAQGPPDLIESDRDSPTGRALRERRSVKIVPAQERIEPRGWVELAGIQGHNIMDQAVRIPLGTIVSIVGVSGSGKSTLLEDVLYTNLNGLWRDPDAFTPIGASKLRVRGKLNGVKLVDSSPIGRTPRSCVLTYLGLYDHLRELFSKTPLSRARGYTKSTFSFNTEGGRCPMCKGQGLEEVKLGYLPPVYVTCPECNGRRFKDEVLQVQWQGKNVADVLGMTVDEALVFFGAHARLRHALTMLKELGLGYLELGQRSPELSGGEAQRLKLSRELMGRGPEYVVYLLDEPTTGLHMNDVKCLMNYLRRLRDLGNTIIIVEHNLDVIRSSDFVIELGPCGGRHGGRIIFEGWIFDFLRGAATPTQRVACN